LKVGERGSPSTTFVSPPETTDETRIPIDLQRFRLATGAPIYVDFKAIPYKDVEVLEWRERLTNMESWWNAPNALPAAPITRVVLPARVPVEPQIFNRIYADEHYAVYEVRQAR
jgi:hypothetical protein